jgi:hypothetical protein
MTITADMLARIASLNLPTEASTAVLLIIAEMQAAIDSLEAAEVARLKKDRERKPKRRFRGNSMENPRTILGNSEQKEIPPAPPKEKTTSSQIPRGICSEAAVAAQAPVYADSRHELWGEGVAILGQLGIAERSARPNIGRWLKDAKDDAQMVLGAIQRARDHRVIDPIPWITRAIGTENGKSRQAGNSGGQSGERRTFATIALERARAAGLHD